MALVTAIPAPPDAGRRGRALLVLRNFIVYRSAWKLFLTGFLEPVLYLFSIGIGVGQLIDTFEFHGEADPLRRLRRARRCWPRRPSTARCSTRPSTSSSSSSTTSSTTRCSPRR